MEQGKQGVVVAKLMPQQNPIEQIQARYKELEAGFRGWLAKQSLPVEAAVVTVTSAAQGAAIGGFMGTLTNDLSSSLLTPPPRPTHKLWPLSSKPRLVSLLLLTFSSVAFLIISISRLG
jgi:predicted lysophospholipase L1 biosynthesis ABC-type transport system permease subunit